jgi:hypothetical protein
MAAPADLGPTPDAAPMPTPDAAVVKSAPWTNKDIGAVTMASVPIFNSPANDSQTVSIMAGGRGIGGTADSFHFMYVAAATNAQVLGNIKAQTMADDKTMSGVMFRESLDPDAAMVFVGPAGDGMSGRVVLRRKKGDMALVVPADAMTAPAPSLKVGQWLRLQRTGNKIVIYAGGRGSVAAANAVPIGTVELTLAGGGDGYFGIAATAGSTNMTTMVDVAGMQVNDLTADPANAGLEQFDLGTMGGVALYDKAMDSLKLTGWGQEWDTVMGTYREFMSIVGKPSPDEFSLQVRLDSIGSAQGKAGILYRAQVNSSGTADIASFTFSRSGGGVSVTVGPGGGVVLEGRTMGYQDQAWEKRAMAAGVKPPVWLRLDKVLAPIPNDPLGASQVLVRAYYSTPAPNGKPTAWTPLGGAISLGAVGTSVIGVLAATYDAGTFGNAVMSGLVWDKPMPISVQADAGAPAPDAGASASDATAD